MLPDGSYRLHGPFQAAWICGQRGLFFTWREDGKWNRP